MNKEEEEYYRAHPGYKPVEFKAVMPAATRQHLKVLAAETGTTMNNVVNYLIEHAWKNSAIGRQSIEHSGRPWHDETGALHNPDGSLYKAKSHAEEREERRGGAR